MSWTSFRPCWSSLGSPIPPDTTGAEWPRCKVSPGCPCSRAEPGHPAPRATGWVWSSSVTGRSARVQRKGFGCQNTSDFNSQVLEVFGAYGTVLIAKPPRRAKLGVLIGFFIPATLGCGQVGYTVYSVDSGLQFSNFIGRSISRGATAPAVLCSDYFCFGPGY